MATISRQEYNNLFGPTVGDKIRLGDTDLYVEIEKDLREYGDEVVYGGGKTIRDGMGLAHTTTSKDGPPSLVTTHLTTIHPLLRPCTLPSFFIRRRSPHSLSSASPSP